MLRAIIVIRPSFRWLRFAAAIAMAAFVAAPNIGEEKPRKDKIEIDLGGGVKLKMVRVPKGKAYLGDLGRICTAARRGRSGPGTSSDELGFRLAASPSK